MALNVVASAQLTVEQWQGFDRAHPAPTFFARPAWAHALADANAHLHPEAHAMRLSDGTRVVVPLMRSRLKGLLARSFSGMPFGSYTAAVADDGRAAGAHAASAAYRSVLWGRNVHASITPWPLAPGPLDVGRVRREPHATSVIDLADGFDAVVARMDGRTRRMAGQAVRRGVTCAVDASAQAARTYHAMLADASRGWGLAEPPIALALLEAVAARGGADVEIWFAYFDGAPIAGGVVLYGAEELFFWSAAMREEHSALRPSNALNLALIRAATSRGLRWYNLGASEGLPGVARFKAGLGAVEVAYETLVRDSALHAAYATAARTAAALRGRRRTGGR